MSDETLTTPPPPTVANAHDPAAPVEGKTIQGAAEVAPKEPGFWAKMTQPDGWLGKVYQQGPGKTAYENLLQWKDRPVKAFARCAGTGVGVYMMGDALLRSKKSDGEDRSGASRLIEFVVGGGVAAGSALAGKGRV
jgi:hypothetical protein